MVSRILAGVLVVAMCGLAVVKITSTADPVLLNCEASLHYEDASSAVPLAYDGTITFHVSGKNTGQFMLAGNVRYQNQLYSLSRMAVFDYDNIVLNQYRLKVTSMERMGHDTLPENVFPMVFKRLSLGNSLVLYINPVNSQTLIIGNVVSPIALCMHQAK
ncbi:FidL-like protein [Mangrovibacter plantisponsor]|uniref:FidL-like putative membrane protein n=1 Tax=Mangrovibacter plantisponsor TaxID=451513 RepID=A0A317Q0K0_9ENTR|nr:FidL-like protein [Mangrovibacter plantisponsor]PWW08088.1 FidL-like putative membrane protein [Mangrovibacter plantisponsor]